MTQIDTPSGTTPDNTTINYQDADTAVRAMLALQAGRMGSWSWNIADDTVTGDQFIADLFGLDFETQPWNVTEIFSSIHPDDLPLVQGKIDAALSGLETYEIEFRDRIINPNTGEEGLRWLGARGTVTEKADDGTPMRMIGVNWDATVQKTHEQGLAMLAAEMDHRVKNAFAVIRALLNMSRRLPGDKDSVIDGLKAQVDAMANAHAVSARVARAKQLPNVPVPIAHIIDGALMPWTAEYSGDAHRIEYDIDPELALAPTQVSPLSMIIFELTTNAVKYGALSTSGGTLGIDVRLSASGQIVIDWRETCADEHSNVEPPKEKGFGATLIGHCAMTLRADLTYDFTKSGLHVRLCLPAQNPTIAQPPPQTGH